MGRSLHGAARDEDGDSPTGDPLDGLLRVAHEARERATTPEIPGYDLQRRLGRGATGVVYLARQETVGGRLVALKVFSDAAVLSESGRRRFGREVRSLARIGHPGVVTIHDVFDHGVLAIAMEYVDGRPLDELIGELARDAGSGSGPGTDMDAVARALGVDTRTLPDRDFHSFAARVASEAALALSAVHAAGLVHRDVKPSNLILATDGHVVVTDFGLACATEETDSLGTVHQGFVGTPAYAAPEQLRGDSIELDAASDIYALGVTLYELVALERPYSGRTLTEALRDVAREDVKPLGRVRRDVPRDLQTIVSRAMEPDPERRYRTAAEFADDLERFRSGRPIQARAASLGTRLWRSAQRHRVAAGGLAAGLVIGILAAILAFGYARGAEAADRRAQALLRNARLSLLLAADTEQIFHADAAEELTPEVMTHLLRDVVPGLARSEEIYEQALETAASEALSLDIETELGIVRVAQRMLAGEDAGTQYDELANARERGLLAFLVSDPLRCVREWQSLDLLHPDPMAEAALGLLYLYRDQPALAYPLLLDAFRMYPESKFIGVDLADAAMLLGQAEQARQFLAAARKSDEDLTTEKDLRIEGDLAALEGHAELALERYRYMTSRHRSPQAWLHHACFQASRGAYLRAAHPLWKLVHYHPSVERYQRDLFALLELAWRSLDAEGAGERFAQLLDHWPPELGPPSVVLAWFRDRVRDAQSPADAVQGLWQGTAESFAGLLDHRHGHATLPTAAAEELGAVVEALEEPGLVDLDRSLSEPAWLRRIQCHALFDGGRAELALVASIRSLRTAFLRLRARLASGRDLLSGRRKLAPSTRGSAWVSRDNGQGNARRARGERLFTSWQEVWRSSHHGVGVLVDEGVVVLRDDPEQPNRFVAVALDSGEELWSHSLDPEPQGHALGCILDGRVLLSVSKQAWSPDVITQRVICLELATGEPQWIWDSGLSGGVTGLQSFPPQGGAGPAAALLTVYYASRGRRDQRIVALDMDTGHVIEQTQVQQRASPPGALALWRRPAPGTWSILEHVQRMERDGVYKSTELVSVSLPSLLVVGGASLPLSSAVLPGSPPLTTHGSPLVIDASQGFLYESGGFLRAYDLEPLTERWAVRVAASWRLLSPLVLGDVVVVADPLDVEVRAYDRLTGSLRWTTPLPTPPLYRSGVVLDGGTLLLPLLDQSTGRGSVFALSADGRLTGPLHEAPGLDEVYAVDGHVLVSTDSELVCFRPAAEPGQATTRQH